MTDICLRIEQEIPSLRCYARALTRDAIKTEDLVQDCMARALSRTHLWREGTDLRAWLFTMMHNLYVNNVRRAVHEGRTVGLSDHEPRLSHPATQIKRIEMRDLERGLAELPEEQRSVLLLVALEGLCYEEAAAILKIPVGTVRSRLSRGRESLRRLMGFEDFTTDRPPNAVGPVLRKVDGRVRPAAAPTGSSSSPETLDQAQGTQRAHLAEAAVSAAAI
jgi:RNA polymerase sigma-70 factor (ECF subfamily)